MLQKKARFKERLQVEGEILQHYELISIIGTGGSSVIYKARQTSTGLFFAIKVMSLEEELRTKRAYRELWLLQSLSHPQVVRLHASFLGPRAVYLVLDLLPNVLGAKSSLLKLNQQSKLGALVDLLKGLQYIHSRNIVHRDLWLQNIGLSCQLRAVLLDFESAAVLSPCEMTHRVGRLLNWPPEKLLRSPIYSSAVDIWAFGCLAYSLFAEGKNLFCGTNQFQLLHSIFSVLGVPEQQQLLKLDSELAQLLSVATVQEEPSLELKLFSVPPVVRALIKQTLIYNYKARPKARELLQSIFHVSLAYQPMFIAKEPSKNYHLLIKEKLSFAHTPAPPPVLVKKKSLPQSRSRQSELESALLKTDDQKKPLLVRRKFNGLKKKQPETNEQLPKKVYKYRKSLFKTANASLHREQPSPVPRPRSFIDLKFKDLKGTQKKRPKTKGYYQFKTQLKKSIQIQNQW